MEPSKPFSETTREMLKDPELATLYLEECLEDGDRELFAAALKDVADAYDSTLPHFLELYVGKQATKKG